MSVRDVEGGKVTFTVDYTDGRRRKTMSLDAVESIRRVLLHVVPDGFRRVRSFGIFGSRCRARNLALCRRLLGAAGPRSVARNPLPSSDTPGRQHGEQPAGPICPR